MRALKAALTKVVTGLLVAATFTFIPQAAQAAPFTDFSYSLNSSNEAIVTGCNSACPSTLEIPSTLGGAPVVVDVRTAAEHAGGHVAGSLTIPLTHLQERIAEIPAGRPVVVHCEGGYRSAIAASLLQKLGRSETRDLVGGFKAWLAAKLPTAT
jgi:rhodanese-related sulfurtransferase